MTENTKVKRQTGKPMLYIEKDDYERTSLAVYSKDTFSGMEDDCPVIYANTDEMYQVKVITPDAIVTISSWGHEDKYESWVRVYPMVANEDRRDETVKMVSFGYREGATIGIEGTRRKSHFLDRYHLKDINEQLGTDLKVPSEEEEREDEED